MNPLRAARIALELTINQESKLVGRHPTFLQKLETEKRSLNTLGGRQVVIKVGKALAGKLGTTFNPSAGLDGDLIQLSTLLQQAKIHGLQK